MVKTIQQLYQLATKRLQEAGTGNEKNEARFLLEDILKIPDAEFRRLKGDYPVGEEQVERILRALERRCEGYPLQYLLGKWEFYGYPFEVGEGVLIPRQDTELLCDVALRFLETHPNAVVLDLCSGSGCVAVVLAKRAKHAHVDALEKYDKALEYLCRNIELNNVDVHVIADDVLKPTALFPVGQYDLITCNPPYLTEEDMAHLQREVTFEPETALYGEADGLFYYRVIAKNWKQYLQPGGMLAFEIGKGQQEDIAKILSENGYTEICTDTDLYGIIRVISARLPEAEV